MENLLRNSFLFLRSTWMLKSPFHWLKHPAKADLLVQKIDPVGICSIVFRSALMILALNLVSRRKRVSLCFINSTKMLGLLLMVNFMSARLDFITSSFPALWSTVTVHIGRPNMFIGLGIQIGVLGSFQVSSYGVFTVSNLMVL